VQILDRLLRFGSGDERVPAHLRDKWQVAPSSECVGLTLRPPNAFCAIDAPDPEWLWLKTRSAPMAGVLGYLCYHVQSTTRLTLTIQTQPVYDSAEELIRPTAEAIAARLSGSGMPVDPLAFRPTDEPAPGSCHVMFPAIGPGGIQMHCHVWGCLYERRGYMFQETSAAPQGTDYYLRWVRSWRGAA